MSEINPPPSALAPDISPLTEADPLAVNELIASRLDTIFNKDPLELTDEDLMVQITYYRRERQRFIAESQAKAASAPKPKKEAPKSVKEVLSDRTIFTASDLF